MKYSTRFNETDAIVRSLHVFAKHPRRPKGPDSQRSGQAPAWPWRKLPSWGCPHHATSRQDGCSGSQMAERWGSRAGNQKVAGSISCRAKWCCVLGQGTSPYLPRGECPCTYCKSLWIRASAKWQCKCKILHWRACADHRTLKPSACACVDESRVCTLCRRKKYPSTTLVLRTG